MKRPMRWYWALAISLVACYLFVGAVLFVTLGVPLGDGILMPALDSLFWRGLRPIIGEDAARFVLISGLATIPLVAGLGVYAFLRRAGAANDGFLHCLNCGYILKGLSEPRCPECGQPI